MDIVCSRLFGSKLKHIYEHMHRHTEMSVLRIEQKFAKLR